MNLESLDETNEELKIVTCDGYEIAYNEDMKSQLIEQTRKVKITQKTI